MALARRFAAQDSPLNLSELALVSLGLYRRGEELLVLPHVVSAVTLGERTTTIRVSIEDNTAGGVRMRVGEALITSKEQDAPPGAVELLRKIGDSLKEEMAAATWSIPANPRKHLSYCAEWDDAEEGQRGTQVESFVHFDGPDWRPLLVGLVVTARTTADRDRFKAEFEARRSSLPEGSRIELGGPVTIRALTSFA